MATPKYLKITVIIIFIIILLYIGNFVISFLFTSEENTIQNNYILNESEFILSTDIKNEDLIINDSMRYNEFEFKMYEELFSSDAEIIIQSQNYSILEPNNATYTYLIRNETLNQELDKEQISDELNIYEFTYNNNQKYIYINDIYIISDNLTDLTKQVTTENTTNKNINSPYQEIKIDDYNDIVKYIENNEQLYIHVENNINEVNINDIIKPKQLSLLYNGDEIEVSASYDTLQSASRMNKNSQELISNIDINDISISLNRTVVNYKISDVELYSEHVEEYNNIELYNISRDRQLPVRGDNPSAVVNQSDNQTNISIDSPKFDYNTFNIVNSITSEKVESINTSESTEVSINESWDSNNVIVNEVDDKYIPVDIKNENNVSISQNISTYNESKHIQVTEYNESHFDITILNNNNYDSINVKNESINKEIKNSTIGDNINIVKDDYIVKGSKQNKDKKDVLKFISHEKSVSNNTIDEIDDTTKISEEINLDNETVEITIDNNELIEEFIIIYPDGISENMSNQVGETNEYPLYDIGSYVIFGITDDGVERRIKTVEM